LLQCLCSSHYPVDEDDDISWLHSRDLSLITISVFVCQEKAFKKEEGKEDRPVKQQLRVVPLMIQ